MNGFSPWIADALWPLLLRLGLNFFFVMVLVRGVYYRFSKNPIYVFTYLMISTVVFLLCYNLQKYELDLGLALGLFAVFGIIRYRTDTIGIKEMTYLFVVIGVSIINALSRDESSMLELIMGNSFMIILLYLLERMIRNNEAPQKIEWVEPYENIAKADGLSLLKQELESKHGWKIDRIDLQKIDRQAQMAKLTVYYAD